MTYLDRIHIYLEDLQWTMEDLQWRTGLKESIEDHLQQDKIDNLFLYTVIFTIQKQYPKERDIYSISYSLLLEKILLKIFLNLDMPTTLTLLIKKN